VEGLLGDVLVGLMIAHFFVCVHRCRGCCSLSVCVCVCDLLIFVCRSNPTPLVMSYPGCSRLLAKAREPSRMSSWSHSCCSHDCLFLTVLTLPHLSFLAFCRLLKTARKSSRTEWKVFLESVLLELRSECMDRALKEARRALEVHRGTGRLWAVLVQLEQVIQYISRCICMYVCRCI